MNEATPPLRSLIERLTGEVAPLESDAPENADELLATSGIGYSQLNEVLLLLGHNRISGAFFQYLVDGTFEYQRGAVLTSQQQLYEGVDRFRVHAMLDYGNIKYAYAIVSPLDKDDLSLELISHKPIDESEYTSRRDPVRSIERIKPEDTYYLGYVAQDELKIAAEQDPDDPKAMAELAKCRTIIDQAARNQEAYLASDHMDVYVATSMRAKHDYYVVSRTTNKVFDDPQLAKLHLRWFDPTQAYCADRLDKGLSEALMLKRASCTLYLAQETDTLGKDSELASTLAQGKPVIAFVPEFDDVSITEYMDWLLQIAAEVYPGRSTTNLVIQQLQNFDPGLAWSDKSIRDSINNAASASEDTLLDSLARAIRDSCDKRAKILKSIHPLGIQVHLDSGVANGVLVARTTEDCARLIHSVLTNSLEFIIEPKEVDGRTYLLLKESISGSVFRVVTGDRLLTNIFWNFYPRR